MVDDDPSLPRRRRRTVILSDVHLSQTHPDDPLDPMWMRYRRRDFHPDADYAALVDHLLERFAGDAIELVWNGDVLDFDAPWVKDGASSFDEFPPTDAGCAAQARRIADDHPGWFRATARLLVAGHRLLVLSGNHDVELFWPGVRRAIREAIGRHAEAIAAEAGPGAGARVERVDVEAQVRFRAWFHFTEDRIYIEHGSQYDVFNGVRFAMIPLTRGRDRIHPMFGKLAFKRTGSRMGYFNPYYEETFYLGLTGYLRHFFAHYARSRRHFVRVWLLGSLSTAREIWRHRHKEDRAAEARGLACAETGATPEAVDATQALVARPAEDVMLPILRELWLDRGALGALVVAAAGLALALGGARAAAIAAGVALALFAVYEVLTPKPDIRTYDSAPPSVRAIFEIHGARALCMGHTHRPFGTWEGARFRGNSGSWSPAFRDALCTVPVLPRRPVLMLISEPAPAPFSRSPGEAATHGALRGGLYWWGGGELAPDAEGAREADGDRADGADGARDRRENPRAARSPGFA